MVSGQPRSVDRGGAEDREQRQAGHEQPRRSTALSCLIRMRRRVAEIGFDGRNDFERQGRQPCLDLARRLGRRRIRLRRGRLWGRERFEKRLGSRKILAVESRQGVVDSLSGARPAERLEQPLCRRVVPSIEGRQGVGQAIARRVGRRDCDQRVGRMNCLLVVAGLSVGLRVSAGLLGQRRFARIDGALIDWPSAGRSVSASSFRRQKTAKPPVSAMLRSWLRERPPVRRLSRTRQSSRNGLRRCFSWNAPVDTGDSRLRN